MVTRAVKSTHRARKEWLNFGRGSIWCLAEDLGEAVVANQQLTAKEAERAQQTTCCCCCCLSDTYEGVALAQRVVRCVQQCFVCHFAYYFACSFACYFGCYYACHVVVRVRPRGTHL